MRKSARKARFERQKSEKVRARERAASKKNRFLSSSSFSLSFFFDGFERFLLSVVLGSTIFFLFFSLFERTTPMETLARLTGFGKEDHGAGEAKKNNRTIQPPMMIRWPKKRKNKRHLTPPPSSPPSFSPTLTSRQVPLPRRLRPRGSPSTTGECRCEKRLPDCAFEASEMQCRKATTTRTSKTTA